MKHSSTFIITTPGFATSENDRNCLPHIQAFIKALNARHPELEIIIITLDHPKTNEAYEWFGNTVIPMNGSRHILRPKLWVRLYRVLKKLGKQKKLIGILNFWCADNALVSHYFSRFNKVKSFTWLCGQDARKTNKTLRFFHPKAEQLIALSDFIREEFYHNFNISPAHLVYLGIDTTPFNAIANSKKDIDIIGIGSLTSLKRFHLLVELIERIRLWNGNVRAMIIGSGPCEKALTELISEKQLANNITLYGEADHAFIPSLMSRSKLLVHPSSYEGYGAVCLEALASGCHVVSFTAPEKNKITHWKKVSNMEEMEQAARLILSLPESEFFAVMPHSIEDNVTEILGLFDSTQQRKGIIDSRVVQTQHTSFQQLH